MQSEISKNIIVYNDIPMITYSNCNHFFNNIIIKKSSGKFVQALRDCFGGHTYELVNKKGNYHTDWEK